MANVKKKTSRKKLTDKQKKKIIADYISNGNYSEAARLNGVNASTVKRLVDSGYDNVQKKAQQKKEENTKDILEYMDSIADKQKEIIDLSLSALKEKLEKPDAFTSVKDIATVYGVIYDKALKSKEMRLRELENKNGKRDIEDLTTLADMLGFKPKDK